MPKKGDPGRGRSKEARTLLRLVGRVWRQTLRTVERETGLVLR